MTSRTVEGTLKSSMGFYIGDICYVLGDEAYDGFWGNGYPSAKLDESRDYYEDGVFQNVCDSGYGFAVCTTGVGDGTYTDVSGKYSFPVDAGVIGVVPMELILAYGRKDLLVDGAVDMEYLATCGAYIPVDGEAVCWFEATTDDQSTDYEISIRMDNCRKEVYISTADDDNDWGDYDDEDEYGYDEDEDEEDEDDE